MIKNGAVCSCIVVYHNHKSQVVSSMNLERSGNPFPVPHEASTSNRVWGSSSASDRLHHHGWRGNHEEIDGALSLSTAVSRRRDSVATPEEAYLVGDYRENRSSGGWFAGTARRTTRAVHAARVTEL